MVSAQIVDQLFNPYTGSGLSMLRIGLTTDSNIEPNSPAGPTAPPVYVWDGSDGGQVWFAQQAVKYGVKRFYADSWGAPAYMKTNNNIDNGGAICGGPAATCASGDWRQAYANYVVQFASFYQQAGVPITDLSFVNEPDESVSYASLTLSTAQVVDFLRVFGPTVQASGLGVNMNCCDLTNWSGAKTYAAAVMADPIDATYIHTYTGHEYGVTATTTIPNAGNVWMAEWAPSGSTAYNDSWDTSESGSTSNDGMYLANDISNALTRGNVDGYLYWYADSTGATGGMIQIGATSNASSFVVTKRLFALAGFARFVRPGAVRVTASTNNTNLAITAFINTNGTKVINVVNNAQTAVTASLTLDPSTAGAQVTSYITNATESIAPTNAAAVSGTALTATFQPRSLTNIILTPPTVAGAVQLVTTSTLTAQGDGTYLGSVQISNLGAGTAQNVELNTATLGSAAGSTLPAAALPLSMGDIAPGSFALITVNFPASAGAPGSLVLEKFAGTYSGGTGSGSFGASIRAVLPVLP